MSKLQFCAAAAFVAAAGGVAFGQFRAVAPNFNGDKNVIIATDEYKWDDGSTENLLGWTAGGTMAYIQYFNAVGGSDTIGEVAVINGSALYPGYGNGNGSPISVAVWSDPNGDGNPADAVLLDRVDTTVQFIDQDLYQRIAFPGTAVSGRFFVGGWIRHNAGQFVAPMDQSTSYTTGRAWVFGGNDPNAFNPNNPAANQYVYEMASIGFPANFCVRASSGGAAGPQLSATGSCPGLITFNVSGGTPGGNGALVYGFGTGPTTIPNTFPCAGTQLNVGNPNLDYQTIRFDANGNASFRANVPSSACRVNVQALDLGTCATSNVVNP